MNFRIVQLPPDEWQRYRDIRLQALQTDPRAFASSYSEEVNQSQERWRDRIGNMWFAVVNKEPVGMVGLLREESESIHHIGYLISLWVRPEFQKRGMAKALVGELQSISPQIGIKKLSLQATVTQKAAIQLYDTMGFKKIALLKANLLKDGIYLDDFLMEWHLYEN